MKKIKGPHNPLPGHAPITRRPFIDPIS
jgi:hypothetical protein